MRVVETVAVEKKNDLSITLFIHSNARLSLCWRLELGTLADTKYVYVRIMFGEGGIIAYVCYG